MGAFNDWVRGSYLEHSHNRQAVHVAHHMLRGTALLHRAQSLALQGVVLPPRYATYQPEPL
jgi:hypothetical protein